MTRLQLRLFLSTAYISANSSITWQLSTTTFDVALIRCVYCTSCGERRHSSIILDPTYATTSFFEILGIYHLIVQCETYSSNLFEKINYICVVLGSYTIQFTKQLNFDIELLAGSSEVHLHAS